MEPRYSLNQYVRMRAMPERAGLVTEVTAYPGGWMYRVFCSAADQPYVNESGLELVPDGNVRTQVVSRETFLRSRYD